MFPLGAVDESKSSWISWVGTAIAGCSLVTDILICIAEWLVKEISAKTDGLRMGVGRGCRNATRAGIPADRVERQPNLRPPLPHILVLPIHLPGVSNPRLSKRRRRPQSPDAPDTSKSSVLGLVAAGGRDMCGCRRRSVAPPRARPRRP